jgi:hypothetical protein
MAIPDDIGKHAAGWQVKVSGHPWERRSYLTILEG